MNGPLWFLSLTFRFPFWTTSYGFFKKGRWRIKAFDGFFMNLSNCFNEASDLFNGRPHMISFMNFHIFFGEQPHMVLFYEQPLLDSINE